MPEADIIVGVERMIKKYQYKYPKCLRGRLALFPSMFPDVADTSSESICSVVDLGFDHAQHPAPDGFIPDPHDASRSKGEAWETFLKPLPVGNVFVYARGRECVVTSGPLALVFPLGVGDAGLMLKREDYEELVRARVPRVNDDEATAGRSRSFVIPHHLTVEGNRLANPGEDRPQTVNIPAAVVGEDLVFVIVDCSRNVRLKIVALDRGWTPEDLRPDSKLWDKLWDANYGPCWIKEPDAALARLERWRSDVLSTSPPDTNASLVKELCHNQAVFNGFGKHLACDFLHEQCLWPGMPLHALCADDALFLAFKEGIVEYMQRWMSQDYWHDCLGCYNLDRPFAHNRNSDQRYLGRHVQVFRKAFAADMPAELYNKYVERGLLNPDHVIGQPYTPQESELSQGKMKRMVPVYMFVDPDSTSSEAPYKFYTIIRARRPDSWGRCPGDARLPGSPTVFGPASSPIHKNNQLDPTVALKPGRARKHRDGQRGRPAKDRSKAQLNRDSEALERLRQRVEERMEEDEVAEEVAEAQAGRPAKRARLGVDWDTMGLGRSPASA
ncbi:hypothetical protein GSI_07724 [Ganoderma sinense ZZ0214-1]|uniref:Uncharacterized protein n=1 Tax=Ganoderma sinense ZZ0214-1 TaxID=1077348 RepID=A0A2G8S8P0_9APHY|nr:hypothetical protein GSI_07724 [Ganoderma sinense ZZ0214-1]